MRFDFLNDLIGDFLGKIFYDGLAGLHNSCEISLSNSKTMSIKCTSALISIFNTNINSLKTFSRLVPSGNSEESSGRLFI